jgi:hypothetical protein
MKEKTATARMGSFSNQSFLFFLLLYPAANVAGVFVPLKRVEWAGGSALVSSVLDSCVAPLMRVSEIDLGFTCQDQRSA